MSEPSPTSNQSPPANGNSQQTQGSSDGPTPNPRSCVTCRRRKVKCDKKNPCSNCVRAKIECVFPGPGRAPRKSRKPPDAELLERLRRLEGVVSSLNAQVEEHEQEAAERERQASASEPGCLYADRASKAADNRTSVVSVDGSVEGLETRFGRLVVEKGRSRYVNNSFWASLNNEVEDLKAILDEPSEDEDDAQSPDSSHQSAQHQGFLFGYSSVNVDMQPLRPIEQQARQFWSIFKENVDPLVKVLHIPTFEPVFFDAVAHPERISKPLEPLLFTIYYGAITSTSCTDCIQLWGEDRATLLDRYRFGLEQALARANFLHCDEVLILQAFAIFLILLRRNDAARKIWTLTGLVVRIAQTLGIHRDGSHFNLSPFEIEMRRRLWWQVCILDARASEDHGCDPTIVEAQFDTKMPLNVNDSDLHPDMTEFPEERKGFTDMTFGLLRFEVANIFRRIFYIPPGPNGCTEYFVNLTIAQKEKWISECHERLEDKYLKDCDMSVPLCWVTATVSRLVMSKMWLIVYHPYQRKDGGTTLPQETRDKLFITSLENIEYSILLETEARTMKWGWLFRTYVQWHAVAFLLSELCIRTKGEAVERAWRALEATASRWWFPLGDTIAGRRTQPSALWRPLRKLLTKARTAREKELMLERASVAIRNGEQMYPGFPQGLGEMKLPPLNVDQPSSENLDKMLRNAGPKLGETPPAIVAPTWPSAPLPNGQRRMPTFQNGATESPRTQSPRNYGPTTSIPSPPPGPQGPEATKFPNLISHGFDSIMYDIMGDLTFDGTRVSDATASETGTNIAMATGTSSAQQPQKMTSPPMPTSTNHSTVAMQQTFGTFGDEMFANLNFADTSPTLGQNNDSPTLDSGSMDWAMWDDMVTQYGGVDAQISHPNIANPGSQVNPAGNLGMVNWF